MKILTVLPFVAATLLPLAAQARTLLHPAAWQAPEGCEIFMTVQSKACRVSNFFRCTGDVPGDLRRADFDQEGLFFRSRINSETEWVESIYSNPPVVQTLDPNPEDPASFSGLLETGYDSFKFSLTQDNGGHSNVTGFDRLTGRKVTIDGIELEETEYEYLETDDWGATLQRARGNEYVSREHRSFFSGPGETDLGDGQWRPMDGSPLQFVFPGEPGFASTQPIFDCAPMTASGPALPGSVWRVRHGD